MREIVIAAITRRFRSYRDLAGQLSEDLLDRRLDVDRSKSLREQLWCVIGARESYTAGLEAGAWQGFACSLNESTLEEISDALAASEARFREVLDGVADWTDGRVQLLADLLEHEVMHEGQIIRLVYGLGGELPDSWKWS